MTRFRIPLLATLCVIGSAGCRSKGTVDAGAPVVAGKTEADLWRDDLNALPVTQSLPDQLAAETRSRLPGTPTIEAMRAALTDGGIALPEQKQYLGRTVLAQFCGGAVSPGGLAISVCEYSSPEKAERGKAYSLKSFAAIQNRTLVVRANSVLTIVAPTAAAQAEVATVKSAFEKLELTAADAN